MDRKSLNFAAELINAHYGQPAPRVRSGRAKSNPIHSGFIPLLFGLETTAPWASSQNATMTRTRMADTPRSERSWGNPSAPKGTAFPDSKPPPRREDYKDWLQP